MLRRSGMVIAAVWMCSGVAHGGIGLAASAPANPALVARDSGIADDSDESASLDLSSLEVQVDVAGHVAQTTVVAHFDNTAGGDLEGTFSLRLPDGAVVTGYALDVESDMIDGVLVPPIRARRAYEQKVRAGIDPGVAEVSRGNVFSTRVYPVLAGRGRTVRITFAAPVHGARGFTLPLATPRPVKKLALHVRLRAAAGTSPDVRWPVAASAGWRRTSEGLVSEIVLRNQSLSGALHIAAATADGAAFVTRHTSGRRFIELRDAAAQVKAGALPRSARVYWDRSLSRRDDRVADELAVMERYFAAIGLSQVEIVPFSSSGAAPGVVQGVTQAVNLLRDLGARGATSFEVLAAHAARDRARKVDICLMFTDGVATIDARPELDLGCPLYIVTSAADADSGYLELLARRNGGSVLRLAANGVAQVVHELRWPAPRVVDVRSPDGRRLGFAPLPAAGRGWALVAEAPDMDEVVVRIAGVAGGVIERRYRADGDLGRSDAAGALWAHDRVGQMAGDGRRQQELEALSRRYSVASPAMSFIVLEAPQDYVAAKIEPPRSYPKRLLAEFHEAKRAADVADAQRRREWLDGLAEAWREHKHWWASDPAKRPREKRAAAARGPGRGVMTSPAPVAVPETGDLLELVVVTGHRSSERNAFAAAVAVDAVVAEDLGPPQKQISVELAPWNPERPYLRALEAASAAGFEGVLAAQEREFGSTPAFYFDVAEWLYRRARAPEAIEMLLSALELPARDTETIALVADRLLRYGHVDRAIWLYEEVCRLDPDRPQPARTLALALAHRSSLLGARTTGRDLVRALELLTSVVMMPPADEYRGIELIALMDANALIPKLRRLGRDVTLDPRLIGVLDVDLRVVIEWNTGATDMDLWVDQPDGERSIYSNPNTQIGGRLSNDMTQGYGPEQYLLRRAVDGEYAIRVNVYSGDALNPNGATMVTARLTRNYGRADETTETMELELSPDDEGEKLVGRFNVGEPPALSRR